MALNPSGLSEAVLALRAVLGEHINGLDENRINIGAPKQTQDELTGSDQQLSIFVYNAQISPNGGGYPPHGFAHGTASLPDYPLRGGPMPRPISRQAKMSCA